MFALHFRSMLVTVLLFAAAAAVVVAGAWAAGERESRGAKPVVRTGLPAGR